MPANQRQPGSQPPASPNAKATARYTNKDGSKIITVPKGPSSAEPSQPSTPTSSSKVPLPSQPPAPAGTNGLAQPVNRKKQKRRAKAAAKAAAAEQAAADAAAAAQPSPASEPSAMSSRQAHDLDLSDDEEDHSDHDDFDNTNGVASGKSKKSKKKKKKGNARSGDSEDPHMAHVPHVSSAPRGPGMSKERIWNTSSSEERERIKEFWLGLGEEDRKSLVKVEKDAVLKKMKEHQNHTCSCTVCGRKRIAIEEELEGLYDAYYEELESFAHQPNGRALPQDFPVHSRLPPTFHRRTPSRGRIVEHVGDDEDDEEFEDEYSEEELDEGDEYSVDEPPEDVHPHDDFLTFGNSLQVKGMQLLDSLLCSYGNMDLGGILTVADDLLKNDGKRFIEMMEQLAERRMAREEDARERYPHGGYGHPANGAYGNSDHPPPDDDYDEEDEEDEEEYEDSQDEEYEDEEVSSSQHEHDHRHSSAEPYCCHHQDPMTEEQRMEEGRRMFQIFAARMFEQRVLNAYRDMVAQQRQDKLLEELDEEQRLESQRKEKKARDAQKRKDKAAAKKQQQAEEKARKEAEKAAEEAAKLEEQQRRQEQQRQRAEEKRRKKEEQRRAEEEERLKKEAERQRRIQEQHEKRAEQERKAREARDKEKKAKEEARQREKEARGQKEKEQREKREKQERDKRDKEAKAKADREAKAKAEKEARERAREEKAVLKVAAAAAAAPAQAPPPSAPTQPRRASQQQQPTPGSTTILPSHPPNPATYASPKVPVATPALPKAPTPSRPKTATQPQDTNTTSSTAASQSGSAQSQNPSPHPSTPAHPSPHPFTQQRPPPGLTSHPPSTSPPNFQGPMDHGHGPFGMSPSMQPQQAFGMPPQQGFSMQPPPGFARPMPGDPGPGFPQPGFAPAPGMMSGPPGFGGPAGRGFPPQPPPGFSPPQFGQPMPSAGGGPPSTHSRQPSGGFNAGAPGASQPIGRPAPIGRPGSVVHGQGSEQKDDGSNQQLGSSALLDDSEEPLDAAAMRQRHHAPGPRAQPFPGTPFGLNPPPSNFQNDMWTAPGRFPSFGGPAPGVGDATWGNTRGPIPPMHNLGANLGANRVPRTVTVRRLLCLACKALQSKGVEGTNVFSDLESVVTEVDKLTRLEGMSREPIAEAELLDLAETEGNSLNGGGSFDIRRDDKGAGKHTIRWAPDSVGEIARPGPVGEIGSPIIGAGQAAAASVFSARGS